MEAVGLEEPWPLQATHMRLVVLVFRNHRYRSTENYLVEARRYHHQLDHAWTPSLEVGFRDCLRLSKRRLGPPRQSKPFDPIKIARSFALGKLPPTRILMPAHVMVSGALCFFRGAEVGELDCEDVLINTMQVCIRVSASKTDARGRGMRFRWRCICTGLSCRGSRSSATATTWMLCVYCLFVDMATKIHGFVVMREFGKVGGPSPFFATRDGSRDHQILEKIG